MIVGGAPRRLLHESVSDDGTVNTGTLMPPDVAVHRAEIYFVPGGF